MLLRRSCTFDNGRLSFRSPFFCDRRILHAVRRYLVHPQSPMTDNDLLTAIWNLLSNDDAALYAFNAGFWPVLLWGVWAFTRSCFNDSDSVT